MHVDRLSDGCLHIKLSATDWTAVVAHLGEAWPHVARAVEEFIVANPAWEWDRLRVYARFDSGTVWFSPDPKHPKENANVAGVELALLDTIYHSLPDAETAPEAFDRSHEEMVQRVSSALRQSALIPEVRASLGALQRVRSHLITFVQYDDIETEMILVEPAEIGGAG
jgi:hypothetical protein